MKIFTTNIFVRCAHVFGAMLFVVLIVPAIVFSQAVPVLTSPADVATGISTSPTLNWGAAVGDTTYRLQISTNVGFTGIVFDDATLTTAAYTYTGLINLTQYFWRVSVKANFATGGGTSAFSTSRSFTTWASTPSPSPVLLPVNLGMTRGFAILSYAGITNVPTSAITGNIGASPIAGSFIGVPQTNVVGTIYAVDATGPTGSVVAPSMLTVAMGDLTTAFNDAAGRTVNPIGIAGNLGGRTLYSGLYKSNGTLEISAGDLTLDAQGDANAVWIFQIATSFNMTSGRQVFLSGGAKASNIFWQVGSAATFGTTTVMKGTIMAGTTITFATGATLEGRALAKTADVTLQANTIGGTAESPLRAPIYLQTAANFRILAGTAVTINVGNTVTGDVGGSTVTNNGTLNGTGYTGATVTTGQAHLTTAYDDAAGRTVNSTLAVELGGTTQTAGVYNSAGTFTINGTLTLSGTVNDVFIFKAATTLTTGIGSSVTLSGGVLASNVFWQVGSSATIDGNFKGIILALTAITQNSNSNIDGRLLARNSFVTVGGTTVLPVELVSFTASSNQKNASLHWTTATEVNNYGFEVQRTEIRSQNSDNNWTKTGFVEGNGTTNSPKNYSYTDNNLTSGTYSYRLKQIDRDGKFEYSQSVEVTIGQAPKEFALLQNYPNPFNPSTTINYQLPVNNHVSLKVYDMIGSEVAVLVNSNQEAGSYAVKFNAASLSSGIYFYRLEAGSSVSTKKFILMK